ncbi:hypothetical protein ABGB07_03790 [Micromonosporaceae bacterium B7E4]
MTIRALKSTLTPLALWVAGTVADHDAQEVIDETAWDAADEDTPYRTDGQSDR